MVANNVTLYEGRNRLAISHNSHRTHRHNWPLQPTNRPSGSARMTPTTGWPSFKNWHCWSWGNNRGTTFWYNIFHPAKSPTSHTASVASVITWPNLLGISKTLIYQWFRKTTHSCDISLSKLNNCTYFQTLVIKQEKDGARIFHYSFLKTSNLLIIIILIMLIID